MNKNKGLYNCSTTLSNSSSKEGLTPIGDLEDVCVVKNIENISTSINIKRKAEVLIDS